MPSIASVGRATDGAPTITQNTWVQITGTNLAPDTRTWQNSDFVNNQLPTKLDGVGVRVNGKDAFVSYISPTQVNVLTPLDTTHGPIQVQLTNSTGTSPASSVQMVQYAPGLFSFSGSQYVAAIHLDGSYVGPLSLYPGLSSPAKPGELITLYGNGFGQTIPAVVSGSLVQSGTLPEAATITVGGVLAAVQFAGTASPGLYQFNITVPDSAPDGDNLLTAGYAGFSTQKVLITVQR